MPNTSNIPETYAFIDSQNLNLGTQRMGWKVDWRRFRHYMSENEDLYEYMHELGYLVVLKPTVDVNPASDPNSKSETNPKDKDGKDKSTVKGNVDAELVLYAMKEIHNYQKAIIVSGDGDFFSLAEYLEEQDKLANISTPNWQYSSLLKSFEPKIVRLDQLRRELAYHDRKKK
jgi:uncharacterized LabA/DUF88 family protein